ncbi:MAG: TIGR02147 family protein [Deltaproteobacteria bacterium]|nr:TIGR02147 family protein [Deltaproteobacteria bacterium]
MQRPQLHLFESIGAYLTAMAEYRRSVDPSFSVAKACRGEYRCSPALVSLVLAGKRPLTLDRLNNFCHIFGLNVQERLQLKLMLEDGSKPVAEPHEEPRKTLGRRRRVSSAILKDWLNPYVKDAIRLESVRRSGVRGLFSELVHIANEHRIEKAVKFLRHHGYIKVNESGQLVESEPLAVVPDAQFDAHVRKFHANALKIAQLGLTHANADERLAQAMILPLDAKRYVELVGIIRRFSEELQSFTEHHADADKRLYQLILHLTPTGGFNFNAAPTNKKDHRK